MNNFGSRFVLLIVWSLMLVLSCNRNYNVCKYVKNKQVNVYKILDGELEEVILFEGGFCYKLSLGLRPHYGSTLQDSYCSWREIGEDIVIYVYYPTYIGTYLNVNILRRNSSVRYFMFQVYTSKISGDYSYLGLGYSDTLQKVLDRLYCSKTRKTECYVEIY